MISYLRIIGCRGGGLASLLAAILVIGSSNDPAAGQPGGPMPAKSGPVSPAAPENLSRLRQEEKEPEEPQVFDQNTMFMRPPPLKALISISEGMNPLALDATSEQPISLRESLLASINNNLDIGIANNASLQRKWNYVSSLGRFLPDAYFNYNDNYLRGRANVPLFSGFPSLIRFNNPFLLTWVGFRYYGYQGGRVLFGALESKHNYRAAGAARKATISDVLLDTTRRFYNLMLNEALLHIQIRAVQTSNEQLVQNTDLHDNGLATQLDVLQARTQLAKDRQNLIDQQIARRNASVQLAHILNASMAVDLVPSDRLVKKVRLVSEKMKINDLLKLAIDNRPELKQYEELRLAAKRAIVVATAPLQPNIQLTGNIFGIGETLSDSTVTVPSTFQPVVVSGGPLAATPVAPIPTLTSPGGAPLSGLAFPVGAVRSPPVTVSRQIAALYTIGFRINWNLGGLGAPDAAGIQAARYAARQAHLQATSKLLEVVEQVRGSYLSTLSTEKKIEEASAEVDSSREELRLARLRFQNGLGTNLDVIQAQRDYTSALIDKAQAIINFDIAEAQLLHDIGLISVDNLTATTPLIR